MATDPQEREDGAENVSDWAGLFDHEEADSVALLLACLATVEVNSTVREAQLHAILEISDNHTLRPESLRSLGAMNRNELDREQLSYLNDLGLGSDGEDRVDRP